jgi:hypothetical protein
VTLAGEVETGLPVTVVPVVGTQLAVCVLAPVKVANSMLTDALPVDALRAVGAVLTAETLPEASVLPLKLVTTAQL